MLGFNSLLTAVGLDPSQVRLLRHRHRREFQRLVYQDAIHHDPRFEQYQSGQTNPTVIDQICSAAAIAAFVVGPARETVFVGLWSVMGSRRTNLPDPYMTAVKPPRDGSATVLLERMADLEQYCGRIVIDWGGGERAWVQYANRRDKEIIEIRRTAEEPHFPGFSRFACGLHEVEALPATWLEALRTSRGVYLLVDRESGAQYVGSATGEDGFIGRWRCYADGHGGNAAMRQLAYGPERYDVRILETVGSGATYDEVCNLESVWKDKLGSRVKGLNRN
jgi:hypothetical protein